MSVTGWSTSSRLLSIAERRFTYVTGFQRFVHSSITIDASERISLKYHKDLGGSYVGSSALYRVKRFVNISLATIARTQINDCLAVSTRDLPCILP